MICHGCGVLVPVGMITKSGLKRPTHSFKNHLSTLKHNFETVDSLLAKCYNEMPGTTKKRKIVQSKLVKFSKPLRGSPKDMQKYQDVKVVKCICKNSLPLAIVKDKSFREMINAFKSPYNDFTSTKGEGVAMSVKKVQLVIINIESLLCNSMIEELEGQAVSVTIDHWTLKANHNYSGITAHFITKDWNLESYNIGLFYMKGGPKEKIYL